MNALEHRPRWRWIAPLLLVTLLGTGGNAWGNRLPDRDDDAYDRAHDALDDRDWDEAAALFGELADGRGDRAEASLYWKAYAQAKQRRFPEAMRTLDELERRFPDGRWEDEARSLRVEARQASGDRRGRANDGGDELDCEMKVQALQYLMQREPERAEDRLSRFLDGNCDSDAKSRALFVLAQSGSSAALDVLRKQALQGRDRDLRVDAVQTIGVFGGDRAQAMLDDIYERSEDREVRVAVLHGYMISGQKASLLEVLRRERDGELRETAIQQLGVMGASDQLEALYDELESVDERAAVLSAFMISGKVDALARIARTERNPDLREAAIQQLGVSGATDELESLMEQESSPNVREALLQAFMISGKSEPILRIARDESADSDLREQAVQLLGVMGRADRLLEIFESSRDEELREEIVQALFIAGRGEDLLRIARSERNPEVRREAVRSLGLIGGRKFRAELVALWDEGLDEETSEAVLQGLMLSGDADALIDLARRERDPKRKARIVQQLVHLDTPEAREFMLEILGER